MTITDEELAVKAHLIDNGITDGVRILRAIRAVESGKNAHAVRFEPNIFRKNTSHKYDAQIPFTPGPHGFSIIAAETNRGAFQKAFALDKHAAVLSTSWGAYQTMGIDLLEIQPDPDLAVIMFDHDFQTASEMLLVTWFSNAPHARRAAVRHDWINLARLYNGLSNIDHYSARLQEEYNKQLGK